MMGILVYILVNAYREASFFEFIDGEKTPEKQQVEKLLDDDGWIERFAKANKADFSYPAMELRIKLDLVSKMSEEKIFRVVIDQIDAYKFFCLNHVLKSNDIKYSYYKTRGFVKLVVATQDREYLKKVLSELADYGIEYTIEEAIKRG